MKYGTRCTTNTIGERRHYENNDLMNIPFPKKTLCNTWQQSNDNTLHVNHQIVRPSDLLRVLPGIRLGHVRGERIESETLIAECEPIQSSVHLPRALVCVTVDAASKQSFPARQRAERISLLECPSLQLGSLWIACGMSLGVTGDLLSASA